MKIINKMHLRDLIREGKIETKDHKGDWVKAVLVKDTDGMVEALKKGLEPLVSGDFRSKDVKLLNHKEVYGSDPDTYDLYIGHGWYTVKYTGGEK